MAAAVRFLVGSFTIFVATFLFSSYQLTAYVCILFVDRVGIKYSEQTNILVKQLKKNMCYIMSFPYGQCLHIFYTLSII